MERWTTKSRYFRSFLLEMQLDRARVLERIRAARKEAGLTQQELADVIGVHKRTIENYENDHVPWDKINELAAALGKPVEWFLYGDEVISQEEQAEAQAALHAKLDAILDRFDLFDRRLQAIEHAAPPAQAEPPARQPTRERRPASG